jgi:5-methylcytosine-specific restriction endonuclease McrA
MANEDMTRSERDNYPDVIERVLRALLNDGREAGAAELAPIAYPLRELPPRPSLPLDLRAKVFVNDRFHCRYCGGKVILTAIMELLGVVYPDAFPFHPNWKAGKTHPAIIARSAVVDHVVPGGGPEGGDWLAPENLVTACWPCNAAKADLTLDQLGWQLRRAPKTSWDGLTGFYRPLWELAGRPKPSLHESWMKALAAARLHR